jgi:hypothetical protein
VPRPRARSAVRRDVWRARQHRRAEKARHPAVFKKRRSPLVVRASGRAESLAQLRAGKSGALLSHRSGFADGQLVVLPAGCLLSIATTQSVFAPSAARPNGRPV